MTVVCLTTLLIRAQKNCAPHDYSIHLPFEKSAPLKKPTKNNLLLPSPWQCPYPQRTQQQRLTVLLDAIKTEFDTPQTETKQFQKKIEDYDSKYQQAANATNPPNSV